MVITWDEKKDGQNKKKHRVSVETAQLVFDDPFHVSIQDLEGDEERWRTMGLIGGSVVLLVAHTYAEHGGEETIRIISPRKATRKERTLYEEGG